MSVKVLPAAEALIEARRTGQIPYGYTACSLADANGFKASVAADNWPSSSVRQAESNNFIWPKSWKKELQQIETLPNLNWNLQ